MKTERKIKIALGIFIILLLLSGLTAFPIESEMNFLFEHRNSFPYFLVQWISKIHKLVGETPQVVFYGTDWLAFAHIIIALFFVPIFKKPLQFQVNLKIGMLACLAVFALAFICGPIRGIPFFHQIIDCSFGAFGFVFLLYINRQINTLKYEKSSL